MSLQIAANHLASKGRGPDTQLVHMAPTEVAGLQALAKAHGGSLTINPETGLAEAGFLSSILPTVIGVGLSVASGGTLTPMMAGLMTGAGYGLATGDLMKGLTAGLGAYGGAGLMGGIMGAGAGSVDAAANALAVPGGAATGAGSQAAMLAAQNAGFGQAGLDALSSAAQTATGAAPATTSAMNTALSGVQGLGSEAGRSAFMNEMGGAKGLFGKGMAALAPAIMEPPKTTTPTPDTEQHVYSFDPGRVQNPEEGYTGHATGERRYFNPVYTRMADGGPVSQMSARNEQLTLLANGGQQFADGGTVDYEFDPVTRQYKKKEAAAPVGAVAPIMATTTTSGGINAGLDPRTAAFLDAETPAERDARMQNVSNIIGMLAPGSMINAAAQGIGALVGNQAQPYGGAPVVNMGSDSGFGGYGGIDGTGAAMTAADADAAYSADNYGGGSSDGMSGGYSDGSNGSYYAAGGYAKGTFLRGPGDGVSDSIPATINGKQPARLADGEFVVPARIVSELGNGSSEAGARKLYAMMDRIQKARAKTVGKDKVAKDSKAEKMLPA